MGAMGGGDSGGGDSGDGDKDNKGDDGSDMPKDAPATTGALTAGGDSDNDGDSGDNRDNDNDNNDDNDPTIKDAPATTDAITAKKCPKGQEATLFSASCVPVEEPSPAEPLDTLGTFLGITLGQNYDLSTRKNPDGSTTDILQHKNPSDASEGDPVRIEKTTSRDGDTTTVVRTDGTGKTTEETTSRGGTLEVTVSKDKDNKIIGTTETTFSSSGGGGLEVTVSKDKDNKIIGTTERSLSADGTMKVTLKDEENRITHTSTESKGVKTDIFYSRGKPSDVSRWVGDKLVERTEIAPDDSFTRTSSYEPGIKTPTKVVTDYRDPPRQVTETFDGNIRQVAEYNPQDGWTTTKSTDQRFGSTTTEITKPNPDGTISVRNPDGTISVKNP